MKILHFGPTGYEQTVFNLLSGFINLGHEVQTCDVVTAQMNTGSLAEKVIKDFQPHVAFTIGGWHRHFDAETLWQVFKKSGLPHIYWAIEDPIFFDWSSTIHLPAYDFVFTVSEKYVERYIQLGVPAAYLPHACNPNCHKPVAPEKQFNCDIIVLSNKYVEYEPERCSFRRKCYAELIEPVLKEKYDIKIYGSGWDDGTYDIPHYNLGGIVPRSIVPTIYSSAKIALIIQWDYDGHICYKTFEAFGCKCLQISPYTPVQEKYFKHGEHIIYSRSPEETLYYANYYLKHHDERKQVAERGQEEAYKNHNHILRAEQALSALKLHGFSIY